MVIVTAESRVALRALALPRLVAFLDARDAEHVVALGEDSVLVVHVTARASEFRLLVVGVERREGGKWNEC